MNISKIPFSPKQMPIVSFKARQDDKVNNSSESQDMFVKSDYQDYKNMSYQRKMEKLESMFNDKIKKCRACVRYYKGENEDLCKKAKIEIAKAYEPKNYSLDFLKEALERVKNTGDVEEKIMIAQEAFEQYQYVANSVLSDEDMENANKSTLEKLQSLSNTVLENQQAVYKYVEKIRELDDVPNELFTGGRAYDLMAHYIMNLKNMDSVAECAGEVFEFASKKSAELQAYRQNFYNESEEYFDAIKRNILPPDGPKFS